MEYIKATPALSDKIGNNFDDLKIKEVGDGNLNFVYIVVSPAGSFVIKQVSEGNQLGFFYFMRKIFEGLFCLWKSVGNEINLSD